MDSKKKIFFLCFIVNSISVWNVSAVDPNILNTLPYYTESELNELSAKDLFNLHHGFVDEVWKWRDGRVNFKIDDDFDDFEIDKILAAMYEIERSSCIRFVAYREHNGPDYVTIKRNYNNSFESFSDLGCCHWGEQLMELTTHSLDEHKTILHQLFHTIGFDHHHKRSDRDKYVKIHLENTNLSEASIIANFVQLLRFDPKIQFLTPFDFNSVTMYSGYEFSINNKPVITPRVAGSEIPMNRESGLSKFDIILLNHFYDCKNSIKIKSKIFYENEVGILYPWVVNYHEIQRAKKYVAKPEGVKENRKDEQSVNVEENRRSKRSYDAKVVDDVTGNQVDEDVIKCGNDAKAVWHFDDDEENDVEPSKPLYSCKMYSTITRTKEKSYEEHQIDRELDDANDSFINDNEL